MIRNIFLTALLSILLALPGCSSSDSYKFSLLSLGTTVEVTIPLKDISIAAAKKASAESKAKINDIDKTLSIFDKNSAVSIINNNPSKKVCKVNPDIYLLIRRCREYYVLTQGAFDITVEPLVEAWGFGPRKKKEINANIIKETLNYVGMDKVVLNDGDKTIHFKDPRVRMDFGAIADGYAADEVVKILKKHGIKSAIINMGGDLYCLGGNPLAKEWSIGIRNPDDKNKIIATLGIKNMAVATSGNYENFYIYGGKEYTHIIDPRTGYTIRNNLRSVTVLADDCTTADALATAIFVLGENRGLELVNKLSGINAILVIKDGSNIRIKMSDGMKEYLRKNVK